MNNKYLIGGVALALLLGVIGLFVPSQSGTNTVSFGSNSGPESSNPYQCTNGVCHWYFSIPATQATTTPCAFKAPLATSTLVYASINVFTASSTATVWDMARAATAYATTSALQGGYTLGANPLANGMIQASTSPVAAAVNTFTPGQFLVFGVRQAITVGDTAGTGFVPKARCEAEFITAQ